MIECPANFFGRGKDFDLAEDPAAIQEIEKKWQAWEIAHPDDPTGELALEIEEKRITPVLVPTPAAPTQEKKIIEELVNLRLQIPSRIDNKLKAIAKAKRKRPRDIVVELIEKYTLELL